MRTETISSFVALAGLCVAGCDPASGGGPPTAPADAGDLSGVECPIVNATRPCTSCGQGRQVCQFDQTWGSCECAGGAGDGGTPAPGNPDAGPNPPPPTSGNNRTPAGNTRTDITFEWTETEGGSSSGTCKAGNYAGAFNGMYTPSLNIPGEEGPVPVVGNVNLTLERKSKNGEIFEVTGGKVSGFALGFVPFEANLVGMLDCEEAKFEGKLTNGTYFVPGLSGMEMFEGPVSADYDKQANSLLNGRWDVTEPSNPKHGGNGSWQAAFQGP